MYPQDSTEPIPRWDDGGNTSLENHDELHDFAADWMQGVQDWLGDEQAGLIKDLTTVGSYTPTWVDVEEGVMTPTSSFGVFSVDSAKWVRFHAQMQMAGTSISQVTFTLPRNLNPSDRRFSGPAALRSGTPRSATQFNFAAVAGRGDTVVGWHGAATDSPGVAKIEPPFGVHFNVIEISVTGIYLSA